MRRRPLLALAAALLAVLTVPPGSAAAAPAPPAAPSVTAVRAATGVPSAGAVCAPGAGLLGFSDDLSGSTYRGTQVAGLSAIAPAGAGRLLALVDNIGTTPARFYDLQVGLRRGAAAEALSVRPRDVTVLRRADGTPYTGADFDGEGLVLEAGGRTLLASSETEPSIRRFRRADGVQVAGLPVPDRFRVPPAGEAAVNQTFEALTATPDGRSVYAGMEGPLAADGRDAAGGALLRILRYAGRSGRDYAPATQYAYRADPGLGLAELVAVGDGTLLALERGFTAGVGNTVRIYRVSLTGAPDVTGLPTLAGQLPAVFAGKTLLVDLGACPPSGATAKQPQPNPLLDNVEGMALGVRLPAGRRLLQLISDDNGSATQTTRLYALSVALPAEATLTGRASVPATAYQPGPPSGAATTPANGVTPPYPGQPIPGFSAVLPYRPGDRSGRRLLAMPDNGFGAKTNSADFLLRIYDIGPDYRTGTRRGSGTVRINGFVGLRDPDRKVPFPIVFGDTAERLLTGADFDIESLNRAADGTLWVGEEFGPYLLNVDRTGKVLRAPIRLPDGRVSPQSPDLPPGGTPTVLPSRGFEALAASRDGRTLYPILEGAVTDDPDQRRRIVYEFDTRRAAYTGRTWSLRVDSPELVVGDAQVLDGRRLLFIERDNLDGPAAAVKRLVVADLDRPDAAGHATRRTAVDLLRIRDPRGVSTPARPGEYGVGPAFAFPLVSVESVYPLGGDRVLVANDNNFPNDDGRIAGRPDDTELILLDVPGLRAGR